MKTLKQFLKESVEIVERAPRKVSKPFHKGPIKKVGARYEENEVEEGYWDRRKGEKPKPIIKKEDFSLKPKSKEDLEKRSVANHPPHPQDEFFKRAAKPMSRKHFNYLMSKGLYKVGSPLNNLQNRLRASGRSDGYLHGAVKSARNVKRLDRRYGSVDYIPKGWKDAYKAELRKKGINV